MSAKALGSFTHLDHKVVFSVNESELLSDALINDYCSRIIQFDLSSLTVEFQNNSFLYFLRRGETIHFVHGIADEFVNLVEKVNNGLEGEILKVESVIPNIALEKALPAESPIKQEVRTEKILDSQMHDHVRLHHSFLQKISDFETAYSNAELYFEPFEDPGGDFYWTKDFQYMNLIVLGDCTGHGIQGAMISMSILTLLKQHFRLPPTALGDSLVDLYEKMCELKEDENDGAYDAEMGVIMLDKRKGELTFAGSGIDLVHKTDSECIRYRTKKQALKNEQNKDYHLTLNSGDQIFLFSDGILDQFDANDRKKLGSLGLLKIIEELPVEGTLEAFKSAIDKFKGDTRQMDDQSLLILTV